jgi:hypothetical protein
LNHVQTDAFNRQNRTTGISEIARNRTCRGHAKIDAIDPQQTWVGEVFRRGRLETALIAK